MKGYLSIMQSSKCIYKKNILHNILESKCFYKNTKFQIITKNILIKNYSTNNNKFKRDVLSQWDKTNDSDKLMMDSLCDKYLEEKVLNIKKKIIFNTYIYYGTEAPKSFVSRKKFMKKENSGTKIYEQIMNQNIVPISLKLLYDCEDEEYKDKNNDINNKHNNTNIDETFLEEDKENSVKFPYQMNISNVNIKDDPIVSEHEIDPEHDFDQMLSELDGKEKPSPPAGHWMSDYEVYDENIDDYNALDSSYMNYGTPDPSIPASTVPCGGCGAHLHCQDPSIPGYLPRELFTPCSKKDLLTVICQRCHLLKHYNLSLNVSVNPEDYPKILMPLKKSNAFVVLIVDMTDFPCSIWPGILDLIGFRRPIFIVGNKIDLIPGDTKKWLLHAEEALLNSLPANANIRDISFVSAKTGYGVEELITKIFKLWQFNGNVYLIGCTNVGKSTLFNAFLQSDLCKIKASDLIQRATTSPWPGTTLNLLKFPIWRPSQHEMKVRNVRLMKHLRDHKYETLLAREQANTYSDKDTRIVSLVGRIGRTLGKEKKLEDNDDTLSQPISVKNIDPNRLISKEYFNENDQAYSEGKWCYDTPGTIQPDQMIHLLTTEELILTLPRSIIHPQVFLLYPGQSLFIAGLGQLDFVESSNSEGARFAVMASNKLPLTVCNTADTEEVYQSLLGTKAFMVPSGSEERLKLWPKLESKEFMLVASPEDNVVSADLVLSSAGWIGINLTPGQLIKLRGWTPEGRGIYLRNTPLQKRIHLLRGKKKRHVPMYDVVEENFEFSTNI